ncbi:MAG: serine hydrolase domain-containing protein [Cellvibrio sp.]|uniref:serine hydrolase domain-containing protein n=1 Tax=Cellvibrio sp. TaxID=1965322 RepID=UPI0031AEC8AE
MYSSVKARSVFISLIITITSLISVFVRAEEHNKPVQHVSAGCLIPKGSIAGKVLLENGIRNQVRFLNEPEELSSITDKMSEYKIPALSLAVIKQGEIAWVDIYQDANFTEERKLNCKSLFQAASLSKPVTFMAAVRMQAAGKIDLDKNIQLYLRDFVLPTGKQTVNNPVTLRNIFSHTSGITSGGYQGYARDIHFPADIDILKGSAGANSPAIAVVAPPNEKLAYSGGAYSLAELAIQDIFHDEFARIMKKWILDPAGMKHSDFTQPLPASKYQQVAKGHVNSGAILEGGWRNYPEQAAAGLWSNSTDMATFLIEIYKAYHGKTSIFSQAEIKSLLTHERDGHVYGFRVDRSGNKISITHYGGNAGYNTGMTINLTTGNGLVYLINSENGWELGRDLLLSASEVYGWNNFKQTDAHRKHQNNETLKALSGKYKWNNQDDFVVRFDENNNIISLVFPSGTEYKLTPIVGDSLDFIHQNTGERITFVKKDGIQVFNLYGGVAVKQN